MRGAGDEIDIPPGTLNSKTGDSWAEVPHFLTPVEVVFLSFTNGMRGTIIKK